MKNNKPVQNSCASTNACAHCHFAARTKENLPIVAHCMMFDIEIYKDELHDCNSELRTICRNNGDLFISSLANISTTELFDWRILRDTNQAMKEKRISPVVLTIRVIVALILLISSLIQGYV